MEKFGPKPAFLHPCHLSGREMVQTEPPTHTLDSKLVILCRSNTCMSRNHWVTSDVQFRKGASFLPNLVGHGWAEFRNLQPSCGELPFSLFPLQPPAKMALLTVSITHPFFPSASLQTICNTGITRFPLRMAVHTLDCALTTVRDLEGGKARTGLELLQQVRWSHKHR